MRSKQEILHAASAIRARSAIYAPLCAACISVASPSAHAQALAPGSGKDLTSLRLVAAPGLENGVYQAGVDITLAPGSHTYWKIPGEAGVPPVFTFNGSDNVASAVVRYPIPQRLSEEGITAFGYTGQVVFPVTVTPADRSRPARLHADVSYAVCGKICVPAHGEADITLQPRGQGVAGDLVVQALAAVPREASAAEAAKLTLVPVPHAANPTWTVTWTGTTRVEDIFPVAPEGFAFSTVKLDTQKWSLTATQSVSTQTHQSVPVTLVLARLAPAPNLDVPETLDVGPPLQ